MTAKEWLDNSENAFVKDDMIEFAKYHVQEAVKSIVKTEMSPDASQKIFEEDTKYVQAMYPLENIK